MKGLGGQWRPCSYPGCGARCGAPYTECSRHRPRIQARVVTPEQRIRYNAAARERTRRRSPAVLAGREVL